MISRKIIVSSVVAVVVGWALYAASAPTKSYKGAITAKELLVLLGACNLKGIPHSAAITEETVSRMCAQGTALFKTGVVFDQGSRWLWQPGVMRDHLDYRYAGNRQIAPGLPEAPVDGISMDSSHFYAKWPLFLLAARDAAPADPFFDKASSGLIENLFSRVVDGKPENGDCIIRYRTYTDGTNGVFRWNYQNRGMRYGASAYGQLVTPFYSSTALLDDERISSHYRDINGCYPYSNQIRGRYVHNRDLESYKLLVSLSQTRPSFVADIPTAEQKYLYGKYLRPRLIGGDAVLAADAYEAVAGIRMLVMHYAFLARYTPWIEDFFVYADRSSVLLCNECDRFKSLYDELHLFFFLTRFVHVAAEHGYSDHSLFARVKQRVEARANDLYFDRQREMTSNYGWDGVLTYRFVEYAEWKLRFYGLTVDGSST